MVMLMQFRFEYVVFTISNSFHVTCECSNRRTKLHGNSFSNMCIDSDI